MYLAVFTTFLNPFSSFQIACEKTFCQNWIVHFCIIDYFLIQVFFAKKDFSSGSNKINKVINPDVQYRVPLTNQP